MNKYGLSKSEEKFMKVYYMWTETEDYEFFTQAYGKPKPEDAMKAILHWLVNNNKIIMETE
tara:strand:+ start:356 stop:538 length:183 start_codon:yes stop_codon:yes gene_type:complete